MLLCKEYTLVIDTDSESYAFSKELCSYVTGCIDESEKGKEYSELYFMENGIEDDDEQMADEKNPFYNRVVLKDIGIDWLSPCCVWLNKKYGENSRGEFALLTEYNCDQYDYGPAPFSVGIFFDEEPTAEEIQKIRSRTITFFDEVWPKVSSKKVVFEGMRLITTSKYGEEKQL